MPYEDDGGSLAVSAAQRPGKDRGGERKERHDHQQQGVQEQYEPVGCTDVVEHDVVVSPNTVYLSSQDDHCLLR